MTLDPARELAALVADQLEPGERMVVRRGAPAAGRRRALNDRREAQAVREQAADLAGGDQIAKAQGAVLVRLDDIEQHQEPHQGRIEAGLVGELVEPDARPRPAPPAAAGRGRAAGRSR